MLRAWPAQGSQRVAEALQALSAHAVDTASGQAIAAARDALQDPNPEQASATITQYLSTQSGRSEMPADEPASTDWVAEALEWLDQAQAALLQLETQPQDPQAMQSLKRALHTVKGGAGLWRAPCTGPAHARPRAATGRIPPSHCHRRPAARPDQARALLTGGQSATAHTMSWRLDSAQMDELQARCDDLLQLQFHCNKALRPRPLPCWPK